MKRMFILLILTIMLFCAISVIALAWPDVIITDQTETTDINDYMFITQEDGYLNLWKSETPFRYKSDGTMHGTDIVKFNDYKHPSYWGFSAGFGTTVGFGYPFDKQVLWMSHPNTIQLYEDSTQSWDTETNTFVQPFNPSWSIDKEAVNFIINYNGFDTCDSIELYVYEYVFDPTGYVVTDIIEKGAYVMPDTQDSSFVVGNNYSYFDRDKYYGFGIKAYKDGQIVFEDDSDGMRLPPLENVVFFDVEFKGTYINVTPHQDMDVYFTIYYDDNGFDTYYKYSDYDVDNPLHMTKGVPVMLPYSQFTYNDDYVHKDGYYRFYINMVTDGTYQSIFSQGFHIGDLSGLGSGTQFDYDIPVIYDELDYDILFSNINVSSGIDEVGAYNQLDFEVVSESVLPSNLYVRYLGALDFGGNYNLLSFDVNSPWNDLLTVYGTLPLRDIQTDNVVAHKVYDDRLTSVKVELLLLDTNGEYWVLDEITTDFNMEDFYHNYDLYNHSYADGDYDLDLGSIKDYSTDIFGYVDKFIDAVKFFALEAIGLLLFFADLLGLFPSPIPEIIGVGILTILVARIVSTGMFIFRALRGA